ncbi:hypothetical protein Tco_0110959 [Tanacetum coccineum]
MVQKGLDGTMGMDIRWRRRTPIIREYREGRLRQASDSIVQKSVKIRKHLRKDVLSNIIPTEKTDPQHHAQSHARLLDVPQQESGKISTV